MYGTLSRFIVQPGQEAEVDREARRWQEERAPAVPGFLGQVVLTPDNRPNERLVVVIFDSPASYRANARDPEQDQWYHHIRTLLAEDPEWTDGVIDCFEPAAVPL